MAFCPPPHPPRRLQSSGRMGININHYNTKHGPCGKSYVQILINLTVLGVDKNFPEGTHIKFGLRGSIKLRREKENILKTGNFNKDAESEKK